MKVAGLHFLLRCGFVSLFLLMFLLFLLMVVELEVCMAVQQCRLQKSAAASAGGVAVDVGV